MRSITLSEKDIARFWSKVEILSKDGCWEWSSTRNQKGYGVISICVHGKAKTFLASRISWTLSNGDIPDGMLVCHKCDNPPCCNPEHLFLGTIKDNAVDMANKGRSKKGRKILSFRGEKIAQSKLKEKDVVEIKKMLRNGQSCASISRLYNVTPEAISHIKIGKNWSWIE